MSRIGTFFRQLLGSQRAASPLPVPSIQANLRHLPATSTSQLRHQGRYADGDRVLVSRGRNGLEKLEGPLRHDGVFKVEGGRISHNEIIGKPIGKLVVKNSEARTVFVNYPTLDTYISKTPRLVTPIYASYAASIVDLLDIHPSPSTFSGHRLEILDAGTGHGSLALHLARAIASANPPPPDAPFPRLRQSSSGLEDASVDAPEHAEQLTTWSDYRDSRKAVIHTIEVSMRTSLYAETVIRGFRQGLYWPHIDFHAASVGEWVQEHVTKRGSFLSYALLDLPDVHAQLASVATALLTDGKLLVFAPSITQIGECEQVIQENNLPLRLLKVHELGEGISTGRDWDVRLVTPRARERVPKDDDASSNDDEESPGELSEEDVTAPQSPRKVWVMRPRVGKKVIGGGFVGLWRKRREMSSTSESEGRDQDDENSSLG